MGQTYHIIIYLSFWIPMVFICISLRKICFCYLHIIHLSGKNMIRYIIWFFWLYQHFSIFHNYIILVFMSIRFKIMIGIYLVGLFWIHIIFIVFYMKLVLTVLFAII